MKRLVLDSTIIIKWLNKNKEDDIVQADKILEDAHSGKAILYSPELAKIEVGKVLLQNLKLSQTEAKIPLSILYDLPIQFIAHTPQLAKESYAIASAFGINYYESVFLALSEEKNAVFVTDKINPQAITAGIKILALKDY